MNHRKSASKFADLPDDAFIRLRQMLTLQVIPYSASTVWRRCKNKEFPAPLRVSPGITAWRVGDVRAHLESLGKSSKEGGV